MINSRGEEEAPYRLNWLPAILVRRQDAVRHIVQAVFTLRNTCREVPITGSFRAPTFTLAPNKKPRRPTQDLGDRFWVPWIRHGLHEERLRPSPPRLPRVDPKPQTTPPASPMPPQISILPNVPPARVFRPTAMSTACNSPNKPMFAKHCRPRGMDDDGRRT